MPEPKLPAEKKPRAKKTIESRVCAMVCEQFLCEPEAVTPATNFRNDLDADSLDVIELAMRIEEHFDIEITDDDEDPHLATFESTCELVRVRMKAQQRKVDGLVIAGGVSA